MAARYQAQARQTIRDRIQQESALATEVSPSTNTSSSSSSKRSTLCLLIILAVIVVIVASVVVGVTRKKKRNQDTSPFSSDILQSQQNTTPPTMSPTTSPPSTSPTTVDDFTYVQDEIFKLSISDEAIFDTATPQYLALEWLIYNDTATSNYRSNPISAIIERYVLAVFYYSTNGPGWISDGRFLSVTPVCRWSFVACDDTGSVTSLAIGKLST